MTMQPISSRPVFCSGNSPSTFNNAGASGGKPLCRVHKWTLVYFIAQFSSIWKWNDALCGILRLSVLSNRNNEGRKKNRLMCWEVLQTRLSCHCSVPKGKVGWVKEMFLCHSSGSHLWVDQRSSFRMGFRGCAAMTPLVTISNEIKIMSSIPGVKRW